MNQKTGQTKIGEVNEVNFGAEVTESVLPVLVVFEAPWSEACNAVKTLIEELAEACKDFARVVRVNADMNPGLDIWFGIEYLPTLLCFVKGNECARMVGISDKEQILVKVKECIAEAGGKDEDSSPSAQEIGKK